MSKKTGIYFVGDLVIDQIPDPFNPRALLWMPGGSMYFGSIGAAKALEEHGLSTDIGSFYVGPISDDHFGNEIINDFLDASVGPDYVLDSNFANIFAAVSEDGNGGNKYSFYTRYHADKKEQLKTFALPSELNEENHIFVMGDIVSAMEPGKDILLGFAQEQARKQDIIIFDPNTRPPVVEKIESYRTDVETWIETASVVKASEEDIEFIYPDLTQDKVAEHWQKIGLSAVFVTHGSKGCSVYGAGEKAFIEPIHNADIKRTIGAGDNFNAGIAVALAKRDLSKSWQLAGLENSDWKEIAEEASHTAYRHLLRTNGLG